MKTYINLRSDNVLVGKEILLKELNVDSGTLYNVGYTFYKLNDLSLLKGYTENYKWSDLDVSNMFTLQEDKKTKIVKPNVNREDYYIWINKELIKEDLLKNKTIHFQNIMYGMSGVSSVVNFKELEKKLLDKNIIKSKISSFGVEDEDVKYLWKNPEVNKINFLNFLINAKYDHDFNNEIFLNIVTKIFKEEEPVCHKLAIDLINKNKVLFSHNVKLLKNNIGSLNEKNLTYLAKVLPSIFENINENSSIKKMMESIRERNNKTYDFYWEPSYLLGLKVKEKELINSNLLAIISVVCNIEGFKLYTKKVNEGVYSIIGDDSRIVKEKFLQRFEYIYNKIFIDKSIAESIKNIRYVNNSDDLKNTVELIKNVMDSEYLTNELENINNNNDRTKAKKLKF